MEARFLQCRNGISSDLELGLRAQSQDSGSQRERGLFAALPLSGGELVTGYFQGSAFFFCKRAIKFTSPRDFDGWMRSIKCPQGSGGQYFQYYFSHPSPLSPGSFLELTPPTPDYHVEKLGHLLRLPPCGDVKHVFLGRTEKWPEVLCHWTDWMNL